MAELIDKKPVKGILKNASSFDTSDRSEGQQPQKSIDKGMKWDEMNILATYHPADKDYGHDKIDEPPTPYSKFDGEGDETRSGDEGESLPIDPQLLVEGLTMKTKAKVFTKVDTISSGEDEDDEEFLSEEEKEKKRQFRLHRKQHYNEFQAIKLARQLLQEEDDDDDDDDKSNRKDPTSTTNENEGATTTTSIKNDDGDDDDEDPMEIPDNNNND